MSNRDTYTCPIFQTHHHANHCTNIVAVCTAEHVANIISVAFAKAFSDEATIVVTNDGSFEITNRRAVVHANGQTNPHADCKSIDNSNSGSHIGPNSTASSYADK